MSEFAEVAPNVLAERPGAGDIPSPRRCPRRIVRSREPRLRTSDHSRQYESNSPLPASKRPFPKSRGTQSVKHEHKILEPVLRFDCAAMRARRGRDQGSEVPAFLDEMFAVFQGECRGGLMVCNRSRTEFASGVSLALVVRAVRSIGEPSRGWWFEPGAAQGALESFLPSTLCAAGVEGELGLGGAFETRELGARSVFPGRHEGSTASHATRSRASRPAPRFTCECRHEEQT
jgi:hypothetical protein